MFKYEVWMDGNCLTESDFDYETENEAMEEGIERAEARIDDWKNDNAWSGETLDDFDIRIKEE